MKLNFRKFGEGHPLFILHGVFGSSDNWQTLGKDFAESFTVYLIDARNHGNSPHDPEMNYGVMSQDLLELMNDEGLNSIFLIGHSMGGKTAMHFASKYPEKVDRLIVVDISPRFYPPHHDQIFKGFKSIDLENLQSRKDADDQMAKVIGNFGVRQFILKNLTRDQDNQFAWKINLNALEKNASRIGEALPDRYKFSRPTLFIGGSKSDYIREEDHALIQTHFPNAKIQMIPNAGHWVHAEQPAALSEMVVKFLS